MISCERVVFSSLFVSVFLDLLEPKLFVHSLSKLFQTALTAKLPWSVHTGTATCRPKAAAVVPRLNKERRYANMTAWRL